MAAAKHEKKEPLLRMSRRNEMKTGKKWAIRIVSILVALMIGAVLFIGLGYSPFSVYGSMLQGTWEESWLFSRTSRSLFLCMALHWPLRRPFGCGSGILA